MILQKRHVEQTPTFKALDNLQKRLLLQKESFELIKNGVSVSEHTSYENWRTGFFPTQRVSHVVNEILTIKFNNMDTIYRLLKEYYQSPMFSDSWIWTDFFADENTGYPHFLNNITGDQDYKNTDFFTPIDESELYLIFDDIRTKLNDALLLTDAQAANNA